VAGIVAGRIRDEVNRPALLFTRGDDAMKGSGRSVEGYNLFEALHVNRHMFMRFGGHAMAAGLTLAEDNIGPLRQALNEACALSDEDFVPVLNVDRMLTAEQVTLALSNELARLAPYGKGNREALFAATGLLVENVRIMDEKNTLIFTFLCKNKRRVKGIAFGLNDKFREVYGGFTPAMTVDAAFLVETNVYNGVASPQMRIKAFI
jgi:single-stranded-DNA-specific exonuclease